MSTEKDMAILALKAAAARAAHLAANYESRKLYPGDMSKEICDIKALLDEAKGADK